MIVGRAKRGNTSISALKYQYFLKKELNILAENGNCGGVSLEQFFVSMP